LCAIRYIRATWKCEGISFFLFKAEDDDDDDCYAVCCAVLMLWMALKAPSSFVIGQRSLLATFFYCCWFLGSSPIPIIIRVMNVCVGIELSRYAKSLLFCLPLAKNNPSPEVNDLMPTGGSAILHSHSDGYFLSIILIANSKFN
jgi:hypothetical protein